MAVRPSLRYEDDHWTPDPARAAQLAPSMVAPSSLEPVVKSAEAKALAREVWGKQGYDMDVEEAEAAETADVSR